MKDLLKYDWFVYGVGILVFLPLVVVLLNEVIYRTSKKEKRLRPTFQLLKNIVLPLIAITLIFTKIIGVEDNAVFVKLIKTAIWILFINAGIAIINIFFFSKNKTSIFGTNIPQLFLDIFRIVMVLLGAAIVLSAVWGFDLGGMMTALGLGSFVLGLALQDTLGNLFSGIALVYERPFSVGEVIKVNDSIGTVTQMNWRAIRLVTRERVMIVIPHLVIGKATIENYSRPEKAHILKTTIGFSYTIPPNKVKREIKKTCLDTPGILHKPEPEVKTFEFSSSSIIYEIEFAIDEFMHHEEIMDEFMSRVWYTASRHNLHIPFPQLVLHNESPHKKEHLSRNELFQKYMDRLPSMLPVQIKKLELLKSGSKLVHYGKGEYIIREGDATGTIYIIMDGTVDLINSNITKKNKVISTLSVGDIFGEISMFTTNESNYAVRAKDDVELIAVAPEAIINTIEENPRLGFYLDNLMDSRRLLVTENSIPVEE